MPSKTSNYVEYSMEDKDFYEEGIKKPIFSGEIHKNYRNVNRSIQSKGSQEHSMHDE